MRLYSQSATEKKVAWPPLQTKAALESASVAMMALPVLLFAPRAGRKKRDLQYSIAGSTAAIKGEAPAMAGISKQKYSVRRASNCVCIYVF